jgi:NTE family protein
LNDKSTPRLALVIGSGAVKCAAALGVWKVLAREGIAIDLLVGCSGGSLFASTMALGYSVDECIAITQRLWDRKITQKRDLRSLVKTILPGLLKFDERFGMVDDRQMLKNLKEVYGERTFADVVIPLNILATDFKTGEPVVLSRGALVDALRASISVPFIWRPWRVGERYLIDGAVSNPLPVDVAIREGIELILAVGFENPTPRRVKSISRFVFHINSVMINNLYRANFAFHNLAHHAEIVTILPEFEDQITLFDTHRIPYVIQQGERAMEQQIPYLRRLMGENRAS